jgi:hypothetical protein
MKWFGQLGVLALLSASLCALANPFDGYCAVDLTHAFDENTIYWPTEKGFEHNKQF